MQQTGRITDGDVTLNPEGTHVDDSYAITHEPIPPRVFEQGLFYACFIPPDGRSVKFEVWQDEYVIRGNVHAVMHVSFLSANAGKQPPKTDLKPKCSVDGVRRYYRFP